MKPRARDDRGNYPLIHSDPPPPASRLPLATSSFARPALTLDTVGAQRHQWGWMQGHVLFTVFAAIRTATDLVELFIQLSVLKSEITRAPIKSEYCFIKTANIDIWM